MSKQKDGNEKIASLFSNRRFIFMAGHSKWANIKHRKEKSDKAKGKIFSRLAKEIISAVKASGPDPKTNDKLRQAVDKAKIANMPNDVIDRNIQKASSKDQTNYDEVTYELYGYGGVGIIVKGMTDNRNRFASDMRIATNKKGGTIASPGSVLFNFTLSGIIQIEKNACDSDRLFHMAIDAGVEEFETEEELYILSTPPENLQQVKEVLARLSIPYLEADIHPVPTVSVACDEENREKNKALIDWLENTEDVDAVYHNMEE